MINIFIFFSSHYKKQKVVKKTKDNYGITKSDNARFNSMLMLQSATKQFALKM